MDPNTLDYFYAPPGAIGADSVTIDGEEFAHLVHVMRKKTGEMIRVVDGNGNAYDVMLEDLRKKTAHGRIVVSHLNHNEPPVAVTLASGILKNPSRYDFLVEKATELGVREIIPLRTRRTIPSHAKSERWQKLALAAMKQSCRSYLPAVHELTPLEDLLSRTGSFDLKLIAHETFETSAQLQSRSGSSPKSILLLIGPEGGFTEEEVTLCHEAGLQPLSLGARRLRTETAAIAAMTLIGEKYF